MTVTVQTEDNQEAIQLLQSSDMSHVLFEIKYNMRKRLNQKADEGKNSHQIIDDFYDWFNEEIEDIKI